MEWIIPEELVLPMNILAWTLSVLWECFYYQFCGNVFTVAGLGSVGCIVRESWVHKFE